MKLTELVWLILVGSHHRDEGHLNPDLYIVLKPHQKLRLTPAVIKHTLTELYHVTKTNAD